MLEEQFRASINTTLKNFNEKGMTLGNIYYIFKDCFKEYENLYQGYLNQEYEKMRKAEEEAAAAAPQPVPAPETVDIVEEEDK